MRVHNRSVDWWRVVAASPSLKARLHEVEDEAALGLAVDLAGPKPDALAHLVARMTVVTVRTAREEAIRVVERGGSAKRAEGAFSRVMALGLAAVDGIAGAST